MKVLKPSLEAIDALTAESIAMCVTTDVRPLSGASGFLDWRMCGRLSRLLTGGKMTGEVGETLMTSSNLPHIKRVFLFGFGPSDRVEVQCRDRFAHMVDVFDKAKVESIAVILPPSPNESLVQRAEKGLRPHLKERLSAVFIPEKPWKKAAASPAEGLATSPASAPVPAKETLGGRSA